MHYKNKLKSFRFPKPTQPRHLNLKLTFSKRLRVSHCLSPPVPSPSDSHLRRGLVNAASLCCGCGPSLSPPSWNSPQSPKLNARLSSPQPTTTCRPGGEGEPSACSTGRVQSQGKKKTGKREITANNNEQGFPLHKTTNRQFP